MTDFRFDLNEEKTINYYYSDLILSSVENIKQAQKVFDDVWVAETIEELKTAIDKAEDFIPDLILSINCLETAYEDFNDERIPVVLGNLKIWLSELSLSIHRDADSLEETA